MGEHIVLQANFTWLLYWLLRLRQCVPHVRMCTISVIIGSTQADTGVEIVGDALYNNDSRRGAGCVESCPTRCRSAMTEIRKPGESEQGGCCQQ